ncbi:MAG TPA: YIP1 family protein [Clostridiales bacterium]|nr:YIP1 family protein [Clostridiales bacterium]
MNKFNRAISFFIVILIVFSLWTNIAQAASRDYIIDDGRRIPIPETYILKDIIYNVKNHGDEIKYYEAPTDLFINEQDYLFIADTGNNRIVKTNKSGEMIAVFKEANGKAFNSPKGVFADAQGNLYIADTGNQRIVHLSDTGEFVEEFVRPKSDLLSETFTFDPTKLCVSPTGYIYVLKGENILILDAYNNFRGYMGQTDIGFRLLDVLLRIFASEEQKRIIRKRTAASYLNISMNDKGMIYAVTMDYATGEIKKLNSVGSNIYRKYKTLQKGANLLNLDFLTTMKLESRSFVFGERNDGEGRVIMPLFKDIAVDKNGIVTVVEDVTGKIYQYDQEGNLLAAFGGKSDQQGRFSAPEAIEVDDNGCIYVLDRVLGNIQVFEPTNFIKMVHNAVNLYAEGEYNGAYNQWQKVLGIHSNYPLAHLGLAKSLFKQKMWKESMEEYKQAEDRDGYSKAFIQYRYEVVRNKFPIVLLVLIIIITIFVLLLRLIGKLAAEGIECFYMNGGKRFTIIEQLKLSLGVILHPRETFELIKDKRDSMSIAPGVIILGVLFLVRIFYIFTVHFPLADIDIRDSNIVLEAVKLLLPVVTWVIASFAITAILEGESKLKDIFIASSFSMVPYILVTFPIAILSNVLARSELTLYAVIINGSWIWIFILFLIQAKTLNDYKFGKTISVSMISVLNMALIWAVVLMAYVLTGRLFQFVAGIFREIRMTFN